MKLYIFGYKYILISLYSLNCVMILYQGVFVGKLNDSVLGPMLILTGAILFIHIINLKKIKKDKVSSFLINSELILSICRLLMNFLAFTRVGIIFTMNSPVYFVVWAPLTKFSLDPENSHGFIFHGLIILFFVFEVIYFLEIKDLGKASLPANES